MIIRKILNLNRLTTFLGTFALLASLTFPAGGQGQPAPAPDSSESPARLVSLNGSNTELLYALGLGEQMAGRDDSSIYPPAAMKLPSIGYQYQLNAEGILSLKPTLVIGRSDVKPPQVVEQVKAAGVRVELVDEPLTFDEARERIIRLGDLTGRRDQATTLVAELDADLKLFKARQAELEGKPSPKAVFIYLRGRTTFVLGEETVPGKMLSLAGAKNAMPAVRKTAPVSAEALIAAQPELIVTFVHGLESAGGLETLLALPGVAQTPAGKNRRIIVMDDLYLGGMTNRAGKAALDLLNAMHEQGVSVVKGR